jgi:hypothetical protein
MTSNTQHSVSLSPLAAAARAAIAILAADWTG